MALYSDLEQKKKMKSNWMNPTCLQCVLEVVHEKGHGYSTAAASALPGNYQDSRARVDV